MPIVFLYLCIEISCCEIMEQEEREEIEKKRPLQTVLTGVHLFLLFHIILSFVKANSIVNPYVKF